MRTVSLVLWTWKEMNIATSVKTGKLLTVCNIKYLNTSKKASHPVWLPVKMSITGISPRASVRNVYTTSASRVKIKKTTVSAVTLCISSSTLSTHKVSLSHCVQRIVNTTTSRLNSHNSSQVHLLCLFFSSFIHVVSKLNSTYPLLHSTPVLKTENVYVNINQTYFLQLKTHFHIWISLCCWMQSMLIIYIRVLF